MHSQELGLFTYICTIADGIAHGERCHINLLIMNVNIEILQDTERLLKNHRPH